MTQHKYICMDEIYLNWKKVRFNLIAHCIYWHFCIDSKNLNAKLPSMDTKYVLHPVSPKE